MKVLQYQKCNYFRVSTKSKIYDCGYQGHNVESNKLYFSHNSGTNQIGNGDKKKNHASNSLA